jgi:predicted nicotinamide N-methyase
VNDPEAFIRAETAPGRPALVPEIELHLASEITPIWHASETRLAETGLAPPYWAFAWPGGQALARHLLDHPALARGRRVLDFAAGSGIGAIAAALAGARSVEAAEIDPMAAAAIGMNAARNGVAVAPILEDLLALDAGEARARWDLVLAGDVCYERPMAERAARWLCGLAKQGLTVLLADPGRAYLPKAGLVERARYRVPTSLELEDRTERETVIWELTGGG